MKISETRVINGLTVWLNENATVKHAIEKGCYIFPYKWDRRNRVWVNVSNCYTAKQIRNMMRYGSVKFM